MSSQTNLIYLLGAGRSGTTLLAAILNQFDEIETLGEMHQFFEFLEHKKDCSCGTSMMACKCWNLNSKMFEENSIKINRKLCEDLESHKNIPYLMASNKTFHNYNSLQNNLFSILGKTRKSKWYLDSSKYIARYLLLKKNKNFKLKGIYLVRDPRGVIHSFRKKVQTSKTSFGSIVYYYLINFFAEIVYRRDENILKIKYEDLVESPEQILTEIWSHVFEEKNAIKELPTEFVMPHIVGGNRIRSNKTIQLKRDNQWIKDIPRFEQILYHYICFPFQKINKYKL